MTSSRHRTSVWWLNPFWVFVTPLTLIACVAWLIPEADYQLYWRMPKVFYGTELVLCFWVAAAFSAGCLAAVLLDRALLRPPAAQLLPPPRAPSWSGLTALFYLGFAATVCAYALWLCLIVRQTGAGIFLGVLRGEGGSIYELIRARKEAAITGITSLTQAGIGTAMLGVMLGTQLGWRKVRLPLAVLFCLTFGRSVFLAERLALIELMVPSLVLWLRLRGLDVLGAFSRKMVQLAPVVGVGALYALFTFGESFRSWGHYSGQESSLLWFSLVRLSGYYVTALNNGALQWQDMGPVYFPYAVLDWLWRFPIFGGGLRDLCGGSGEFGEAYKDLLGEAANPEFSNNSGIFVTFIDFGVPGAMVFWALFGGVLMVLYRAFRRGSVFGLFLYPFAFMGLTDQVRHFYLTGGRTFVAWVFLWVIIYVIRRELGNTGLHSSPAPASPSERASQLKDA